MSTVMSTTKSLDGVLLNCKNINSIPLMHPN